MSHNFSLELPPDDMMDFRIKSTIGGALIVLIAFTPFFVSHLLQQRYLMAVISLGIIFIWLYNGINSYRGNCNPAIIFFSWVSLATIVTVVSYIHLGTHVAFWSYPAILTFYFMLPMLWAVIANLIFLVAIYWVTWSGFEFEVFIRFAVTTICVSAFTCGITRVIDKQKRALIDLSQTDSLTGALNRNSLRSKLDSQISNLSTTGVTATIAAIDIDNFKSVNDSFGHHIGDQVIVGVSQYLDANSRQADNLFRMGGEEFLLIFENLDLPSAEKIAQKLCDGVAAQRFAQGQRVTISIGLAGLEENETASDWLIRCDKALYDAKQSGRNRVSSTQAQNEFLPLTP